MANYRFATSQGVYNGNGTTVRDAILDALTKFAAAEVTSLDHGKIWGLQYVKFEFERRKADVFSAARSYDPVELIEMNAEARDFLLTGNTTPTRYPLANALATAKGVVLTVVLNQWGSAFVSAYTALAQLISRYDAAVTAINSATTAQQLLSTMSIILENLQNG